MALVFFSFLQLIMIINQVDTNFAGFQLCNRALFLECRQQVWNQQGLFGVRNCLYSRCVLHSWQCG